MQKIILIGYMGVGKTTVAQLLSEKMKIEWVDLDQLIEKETQLSIKNIFEKHGEIYFRKLEHDIFKKVLDSDKPIIISTGGGTPCYANNHLFLNGADVKSFYLKASIQTLLNRLAKETSQRPLVANQSEEELKEFIAKNLFDRSFFYNQAPYKISVDGKTPSVIVEEIVKELN